VSAPASERGRRQTPDGSAEPDPDARPVRRFVDPSYVPRCATLREVRAGIDALDAQLVELIARRALLVKDATRFKRDAAQAAAPARQAAVYARVRSLAEMHAASFPGLPDLVEATWRTMVGGFVAREQALLAQTVPEPDPEHR
jgi:isochorismate pyruvate lyase